MTTRAAYLLTLVLGCCSCEHGAKEGSVSSRVQYLFNLDKNQKHWPEGFHVESKDDVPAVDYFKVPAKVDGNKLFDTCGYWQIQKEGTWVKP